MRTVFVMCGFRRVRTQYEPAPTCGSIIYLSIYLSLCIESEWCPLAYLLRV